MNKYSAKLSKLAHDVVEKSVDIRSYGTIEEPVKYYNVTCKFCDCSGRGGSTREALTNFYNWHDSDCIIQKLVDHLGIDASDNVAMLYP